MVRYTWAMSDASHETSTRIMMIDTLYRRQQCNLRMEIQDMVMWLENTDRSCTLETWASIGSLPGMSPNNQPQIIITNV